MGDVLRLQDHFGHRVDVKPDPSWEVGWFSACHAQALLGQWVATKSNSPLTQCREERRQLDDRLKVRLDVFSDLCSARSERRNAARWRRSCRALSIGAMAA
jgi:hypothetical protein